MKEFIRNKVTLRIIPIFFVFCVMVSSYFIFILLSILLIKLGLYNIFNEPSPFLFVLTMFISSTLIGTIIAAGFSQHMISPLKQLIEATEKVTKGDFDVKLEIKGIVDIENLAQSFNVMTKEISNIETLRSDFISNFSHEFKTPIMSIHGFAKLLQSDFLTEQEKKEYTQIIIDESSRLSNLSSSILELSRLENTIILTEKKEFWLDEQIRRVIALTAYKWQEKQIDFVIDLDKIKIYSEEDLLQQVWLNLLDNAIKFSDLAGEIRIELKEKEGQIECLIVDNGKGMNLQTQNHLFDKFYQGDKSHAEMGNGLGLSLVKQILFLLKGQIKLESQEGLGSQFMIILPYSLDN
ncbi:MAG: ATP-binding protein [Lactovum sp.]